MREEGHEERRERQVQVCTHACDLAKGDGVCVCVCVASRDGRAPSLAHHRAGEVREVEQRQPLVGAVELGQRHDARAKHAPRRKAKRAGADEPERERGVRAARVGGERGGHGQAGEGAHQRVAGVVAQLPWFTHTRGRKT